MHALKRILLSSLVGVCMMTAVTAMATVPPAAEEINTAQKDYDRAMIEALLAEGTPRAMTLAATAMHPHLNPEFSAETKSDLLARAAKMAPDDAWVQWMVAINMPPSDTLSEPALTLQRLAPDNGAVWWFPLQVATRAKDSKGITEALERIGASTHFDVYLKISSAEWQKFLSTYPLPEPYADADPQTTRRMILIAIISRAVAIDMPNYSDVTRACKSTEQPLAADRREACLTVGRLMRNESDTLLSLHIGAALLRLAGAEDANEVTRNTKYFSEQYVIASNAMSEDPEQFNDFQTRWLESKNEVQFAEDLLTSAGIPLTPPAGWKYDPQRLHARLAKQNKD